MDDIFKTTKSRRVQPLLQEPGLTGQEGSVKEQTVLEVSRSHAIRYRARSHSVSFLE
jgi:hypothetical protein